MIAAPLVLLLPAAAQAAQSQEDGMLGSGLRVLGGMLLVLGLIYLIYALSRKKLAWLPGSRPGIIRVREVRSLGGRKALYLIQVRDRELLLGVSADRMELLSDLGKAPADFADTLQAQMDQES